MLMVWIVFIIAATALLGWYGYLYAGCWIVNKTSKAESLEYLGMAAKAFPFRPRQLPRDIQPGSSQSQKSPKLTAVPPSESDQSPKRPA
jgi:hypothetical protein